MTDRKAELMRAVRKTADDHAKLVLADFLEEQGDPRAMLIRLQCKIAALPAWDRAAIEARWEIDYLLAIHGDAWRAELPELDGVTWLDFERGFVTGVRVTTVDTLHRNADAICGAAPVNRVELDRFDEQNDPVPHDGMPWLRTLRISVQGQPHAHRERSLLSEASELELEDARYARQTDVIAPRKPTVPLTRVALLDEHTSATAILEHLAAIGGDELRVLSIGTDFEDHDSGYFDDPTLRGEGAQLLASAAFADTLEVLDIGRQRVDNHGFESIVQSMPKLRDLAAHSCELTDISPLHYATGDKLARLDIGFNAIGDGGAHVIAQAPRCEQLHVLDVQACELHGSAITSFAGSPLWFSLRELDLSRNPLGVDGALALAATPRPPQLHTLKLADVDQNAQAARVLAEVEWLDQLLRVDISDNAIANKLLTQLASVRELDAKKIVVDDVAGLADALAHVWTHAIRVVLDGTQLVRFGEELPATGAPELQELRLAACGLDTHVVDRLLGGVYPRLRTLSLANAQLDAASVERLLASELGARLDTLVLSRCGLARDTAAVIAGAHYGRMHTLDLRHNKFTDVELVLLARSESLKSVPHVKLTGDPYRFPQPIRDELAARFGKWWYYHADEDEAEAEDADEDADEDV